MKAASKIKMDHQPDFNRLADLADAKKVVASAPAWWRRPAVWLPVAATIAIASVTSVLIAPDRTVVAPPPAGPATLPAIGRTVPSSGSGSARSTSETGRAPATAAAGTEAGDLQRRRSNATRQVGSKTFQLVAGEWIDSAYDVGALLPTFDVTSDDGRRDLLARIPALAPYAALADRVTVVHDGTVYRFQ